jgi:hypothetical protein
LRRFLRRKRQGEDKKTSKEDVAHGAASPGKVNDLLTFEVGQLLHRHWEKIANYAREQW